MEARSSTQSEIAGESKVAKEKVKQRGPRLMAYKSILPISLRRRAHSLIEIENVEPIPKKILVTPDLDRLKKEYDSIISGGPLSKSLQPSPTDFELALLERLKGVTKRVVLPSFWIGNFNVDFLLPTVASGANGTAGCVAIEVDGGIHNSVSKMNKDQLKYDELKVLQIAVMSIENQDINHPNVTKFLNTIRDMRRTHPTTKDRVMESIYWFTVLTHASEQKLEELTGVSMNFWRHLNGL